MYVYDAFLIFPSQLRKFHMLTRKNQRIINPTNMRVTNQMSLNGNLIKIN